MINLGPLRAALEANTLLLTPNNRLKLRIHAAWGEQQVQPVWPEARVLSLDEWLDQLIAQQKPHTAHSHQVRASAPVRRRLWAETLAHFDASHPLIHPRKTAEQLDQAYNYLQLWRADAEAFTSLGLDTEYQRLQGWIGHFHQLLAAADLCTREQQLIALLAEPQPIEKPEVWVVNTESLSPLYQQLLHHFCSHWQLVNTNQQRAAQVELLACADRDQELQVAALWAFDLCQRFPKARIGLVDPNLGNRRAQLERTLNRIFEPSWHLPATQRYTPPYNFSAGTPLASLPLIHTALASLSWHRDKPLEQACQWLLSPFVGWDGDLPIRYWLVSWLREQQLETVSLGQITRALDLACNQEQFAACTDLLSLWQNWSGQQHGVATSGAHWGSRFLQLLDQCNWPGARTLDSEEHQQASQFYNLLEALREADWLGKPLALGDALSWLTELASRLPFQAQTPESPVQVLGVLESAGLQFDYLWVMGLEDSQWPPAPNPNPMLPASLQKHLGTPHASAERELAYCRAITESFACGAHQQVVFSFPQRDGDRDLSPSPLIAHYPAAAAPAIAPSAQLDPAPLQWLSTLTAPPIDAAELALLRGGAALLQKQARCPLAAFFELRLGARRPAPYTPGLTPLDRGNLLHQALYFFWRSQPDLPSLNAEQLQAAKVSALDQALDEVAEKHGKQLLKLERHRVALLLDGWLALEQQRPSFDIEALEQAQEVKIGPLPLKLRIDRIDSINGHWLLIDYKSGRTNVQHWLDQPEEPQLPLYAIALADQGRPVAAIAFAELRQQQQAFGGLCSAEIAGLVPPGINPVTEKQTGAATWPELVGQWREQLLALAEGLVQGDSPHRYSSLQSQAYLAPLQPLLRDAEQTTLSQEVS